ncbi:hypothetical protein HUG20_13675 [Salicibibacter cibi]|uniref:Uncharacterized protein n=1 Tax=Salicibibacter cibi TaxID=2743001 RepID=A0A7T7CG66_9BACI|nr:hypothetical protein [Salicibibacter cibi]QQK80839.1 hypothetical protein HUG20_13675 [Salicibibacter cibi]
MKKPLCMSVYVFGNYTKYIPYYVYSILKSYPNYFVKVFVMDRLSTKENACMKMIKKNLSTNFEIKENYFPYTPFKDGKKGKPFRFLIPQTEFSEFEYVYIGDIDFLITKETPSLLEGHVNHCEKIGLPYSNQIRSNSERLTGLHFFNVDEYYKKMNPIIEYYHHHLDEVYSFMKRYQTDEKFLYHIIEKGIGFGKINQFSYRPHHGFHLGILRINGFDNYVREGQSNPFHRLPPYPVLRKQLLEFFHDPLFQEISRTNQIKEITMLKKKLQ